MIRAWLAVALLAGSWLFGLHYFVPDRPLVFLAAVAIGTVLLAGDWRIFRAAGPGPSASDSPGGLPRGQLAVALALLLPAGWLTPWPFAVAVYTLAAGPLLVLLPFPGRWAGRLGRGAAVAGTVLVAQVTALGLYEVVTARSHDLPRPLPDLLAAIMRLAGAEAAADGPSVVMHTARQTHRLAATWEGLLDPATLCFFAGAVVLTALAAWSGLRRGRRLRAWARSLAALGLILAAWLPVRTAAMVAIYLHRVVRTDPGMPPAAMNHFFSPWMLLAGLLVPALLAWRFAALAGTDTSPAAAPEGDTLEASPPKHAAPPAAAAGRWRFPAAVGLAGVAAAILAVATFWEPVGRPQQGRVMVVERHSTWEPTGRPYDTTWFGEPSSYNYAAVYDYLGQYFEMSRLEESDSIDLDTLADCDVLVIKVPTARYSFDEVRAVERFVERGGGLLLIGDHTNVFKTGTHLNDIARQFGFAFRDDLLYGSGESPYDQAYAEPWAPHPSVEHLPPMDFAVSCSIDPGWSLGRAAIASTGLWNMPPVYQTENFMPVPQHCPEMRYGAFIQLWSQRCGRGRVLAFTDSTIFSNFCVFQPGKAELLRGMIAWLNHRGGPDPRPFLALAALLPLAGALWLGRGRGAWLLMLAAVLLGWSVAAASAAALNRHALPVPKKVRPMTRVVVDRTVSDAPLSEGADTQGDGAGYGLLEQWIARLDCYTVRESGPGALSGDMLVVIEPSRSVDDAYRAALVDYVESGGRLLVIDSPGNSASTANSLLWPFGLSVDDERPSRGTLTLAGAWPAIDVESAWQVDGGEPVAWLGPRPVGAVTRHGKGQVMALGFGAAFNDTAMGGHWMPEPGAELRTRYDALFALLRRILYDRPITGPTSSGPVLPGLDVPLPSLPRPDLPEPGDLLEPGRN